VIWLVRGLKPDFKTIADVRRDNRAAFGPVFREFVVLCRRLELFGRERLAVDGTRIKAVDDKGRNLTRAALSAPVQQADEKPARHLKGLEEADAAGTSNGSNRGGAPADQEDRGDPEQARAPQGAPGRAGPHRRRADLADRPRQPGHGAHDQGGRGLQRAARRRRQAQADRRARQAHSRVLDMGLLALTAKAAMEALGVERIKAVADRGRFKIEGIEACEAAGLTACAPKPARGPAVREGFFGPGGVPLRLCDRHLHLPWRPDPPAAQARAVARQREDRPQQPRGLPGLPPPTTLHQDLSARRAPGERGRARPHGRAAGA
jgi:transposase